MQIEESQVILVKLTAAEGKTFAGKSDGEILGTTLWLGKNDSADNYVEVDEPVEPVEEEQAE